MRKGYVFTLDAVFAILVLILAATVLFGQLPEERADLYTDRMASDVINTLSHTRVSDLCTYDSSGCDCSGPSVGGPDQGYDYPDLEAACEAVPNRDGSILELYTQIIVIGPSNGDELIENSIHEMFNQKAVIDEERFGLALLYTEPSSTEPLELYNSETYGASP